MLYPSINEIRKKADSRYTIVVMAAKRAKMCIRDRSKDVDKCAESIIRATDEIGVDAICTLIALSVEAADWGQKVVYSPKNAAHPDMDDRLLKSEDDYDKVEIIDPRETPRMSEHIAVSYIHL